MTASPFLNFLIIVGGATVLCFLWAAFMIAFGGALTVLNLPREDKEKGE
jgi:hypothetical protein